VTETNVFQLAQPGTFADPLTEVLRNGARALLSPPARDRRSSPDSPSFSPSRIGYESTPKRGMIVSDKTDMCSSPWKHSGRNTAQRFLDRNTREKPAYDEKSLSNNVQ
jgi:hypothetical protein